MITAEEARTRTEKSYVNNQYIEDVLTRMEKEITNACDLSRNNIVLYISEPGIYKVKDVIRDALIKYGYKVCCDTGEQYNETYVSFAISW